MPQNHSFFRLCVRDAAVGTLNKASAAATTLGGIILWGVAWWVGGLNVEAPTSVAGTIGYAALLGIASIVASSVVFFLWRLKGAPGRIYSKAQQEIAGLHGTIAGLNERLRPRIHLFLDPHTRGVAFTPTETDQRPPRRGPSSKWVQFCVSCATDVSLVDCEAFLTSAYRLGDHDEIVSEQLIEEDINCNWSQETEKKLTIQPLRVPRANIFSVFEAPLMVKPETSPMKIRLSDAIKIPGRYRLKVLVTANGVPSRAETFIFEWKNFDVVTLDLG